VTGGHRRRSNFGHRVGALTPAPIFVRGQVTALRSVALVREGPSETSGCATPFLTHAHFREKNCYLPESAA